MEITSQRLCLFSQQLTHEDSQMTYSTLDLTIYPD